MNLTEQFLDPMSSLLQGHPASLGLLKEVWNSYGAIMFHSSTQIPASGYNINVQIKADQKTIVFSTPHISLKTGTGREREALVHELLHLKLSLLGYPKLCQNVLGKENTSKANEIINIADHRIMLPMFLEFGFSEAQFLTPQENIPPEMLAHVEAFAKMKSYDSPGSYCECVSGYLTEQAIVDCIWGAYKAEHWIRYA